MHLSKTTKKIIFFYVLFHLIGYGSFLLEFSPYISTESVNSNPGFWDYQKEIKKTYFISPQHYHEDEHFWPFHNFTYKAENYPYWRVKGFAGIWAYYGHAEFITYMLVPFVVWLLYLFYNKFIDTESKSEKPN